MFGLYNTYTKAFDSHYDINDDKIEGLTVYAYDNRNDADFYLYFRHQHEAEYYEIKEIPQDTQLWQPFKER